MLEFCSTKAAEWRWNIWTDSWTLKGQVFQDSHWNGEKLHQIYSERSVVLKSDFQKQRKREILWSRTILKLIKNGLSAIRRSLSIILAPAEERRRQSPPLCLSFSVCCRAWKVHLNFKVCLPKETFQNDFHRKLKGIKKKKIPISPRWALFVSLLTRSLFPFSKNRRNKEEIF